MSLKSIKGEIKEEIKEVERLSHIIGILFHEGLETVMYELELHALVPVISRIKHKFGFKRKIRVKHEEKIVKSLERLGGLWVKAGEFLGTRPDLIGKEFAHILSKIQDDEEVFEVKNVPGFYGFKSKPVSTSAFGQVHRAKLKDGQEVALKVQRPNIEEEIKTDLKILKWLIKRLKKKKPELKKFPLDQIYKEVVEFIHQELDYKMEAENIAKIKKLFNDHEKIIVPHPYLELSKKNLLVTSWEEGEKISNFYGKGKKIQKLLLEAMIRQYFDYGFFQVEPLPHNFLVRDNKLVLLNFGVVGHFTLKQRKDLIHLVLALSVENIEFITKYLAKLSSKKVDYEKFLKSNKKTFHDSSHKDLLLNFFVNATNYVEVPPNFFLFATSVMELTTLFADLNKRSDFNKMFEEPFVDVAQKIIGIEPLLKHKVKDFQSKFFSDTAKSVNKFVDEI